MASAAAKQVKMGFFVAAGFWIFGIILLIFLTLAIGALTR